MKRAKITESLWAIASNLKDGHAAQKEYSGFYSYIICVSTIYYGIQIHFQKWSSLIITVRIVTYWIKTLIFYSIDNRKYGEKCFQKAYLL